MKFKFLLRCVSVMLIIMIFAPVSLLADAGVSSSDRYLNIATTGNRPVSIDRLLYTAFKEINYNAALTSTTMQLGYDEANDGEKDGVISSLPNMEELYPNLRKVPVVLDRTNIYVFGRAGSNISINSWEELDGRSIGLLTGSFYIFDQIPGNAEIITKETSKLVLDGLVDGEYEVAVLSERGYETLTARTDIVYAGQLEELQEHLYLYKNREHLIPRITDTLNNMFADGRADKILNDIPITDTNHRKTVLHIISTHTEITREEQFIATLRRQFEDDMELEWYTVSLNSKRFSTEPGRLETVANLLRQDCASRNIAAIVVSGDNALEFLTNYYYLYFRNVPVLFYSVSEEYKAIIGDYEQYFTGIMEEIEAYETVSAALSLFPDTDNIYVVNDNSTEGSRYRSGVEIQLAPLKDSINIEYSESTDCASMLARIRELPETSLVLVGSYFLDEDGRYYHLNEMKRLLDLNCDVPVVSFYSTNPAYNAVGGKCLDYEKYGDVIAGMLRSVLNGAVAADIPVISGMEGYSRWVFDKSELDEFGIKEGSLPEGSEVINKLPSIWESDPRFAMTLILLVVLCIFLAAGASVFIISYRKRKVQRENDAKVRAVKERLERIISSAPVLFLIVIDGIVIEINENMGTETGINIGEHILKLYTNPGDREILKSRVEREGVLRNEVVRLNFADGKSHRCLLNLATADYNGENAIVFWAVDIERSERQRDQLDTMRQSLQTILDNMPVSLRITDNKNATVIYANNTCSKMFGYGKPEDMYGRLLTDMLPDSQSNGEDSHKKIRGLLSSDEPMLIEMEYSTAKGVIIDTRVMTCNIDYNGIKSTLAIITDLAKERELQKMRESLQMILDFLPVPVRIADRENAVISYTNKACAELFGVSAPESVYGQSVFSFMPEVQQDGMPTPEKVKSMKFSSEANYMEFSCIKANGEQFDSLITYCIIDYNGKASSLGIIRDLTTQKEYQRMLRDTAEKEKEANLLKSRFLVNMSHEIRTPMNAIIGLTEIELHKNPPRDTKDIYKKIHTSAKNLLEIINDILDLSKIEADKIELFDDEFELEEVLNSALLVASPRLEGKKVEFMLNESLDLPRFIIGDRTRLWQILKNFLDNSAKYTDNGKIVLTVFADEERSNDETVALSFIIEDTGIGIDEEQMNRLFIPYEQIYNDAQKRYKGTGLGMAISKQLCELMGGQLQVESTPGEGTIIHIYIPFKRSKNKETELQVVKSTELSGLNILAVDDDRLSLDIMEGLLKTSDVNITTAQSGIEAMKIVLENRDRGEFFDMILLDYMMDGLDGLETARQIHLSLSRAPKLLMVTAYQKLLLKNELEENGIDDILEKPFIPSNFIHKLCVVLGKESDATEESQKTYTNFKDVHVLLCEDNGINQEVATGMLAQFGVKATVAENGQQGVEILNSGRQFDLIFMDLQMPVMDGYEATKIIRADSRFDSIPIVSLTADAMKEIVDKCLNLGMNDHIAKPIEFNKLNEALCKWLPENKRISEAENKPPKRVVNPVNEAIQRFAGRKDLYEKALVKFAEALPGRWPDFDEAVQNAESTAAEVHSIKGVAGNLSENDVYQCAIQFERSLQNQSPDKSLYEQFVNACNEVKKRILG